MKIILDLCGGTGSWSLPYQEAGFKVYNITWPDYDVRHRYFDDKKREIWFKSDSKPIIKVPINNVYGILAAPPCTQFSFARTNAKVPRDLRLGMNTVIACLEIIWECQYHYTSEHQKYSPLKFWALENPYYGWLRWFLGKPAFTFDPWEFGDPYKKHTALWGYFNEPKKIHKNIDGVLTKKQIEKHKTNSQTLPKFDYMKSKNIAPDWFGKLDGKARRAITPKGFAKAFYEENK